MQNQPARQNHLLFSGCWLESFLINSWAPYLSARFSGNVSKRTGLHLAFTLSSHMKVNHASQASAARRHGAPLSWRTRWRRRARRRKRMARSASLHAVRRMGTLSCSFLLPLAAASIIAGARALAPTVLSLSEVLN
ncbi:Os10g0341401 [Oryza sativa Japonica Group]|uniref:Os10g0341401 protein n=1 Tax=Oryza sativa subsp. japonica TaxID=39947 RepID=A0A0P0XTS8_ORYSJ|nr:hypothetical protein EE612_050772 [Oryza sativa]BAT10411.1 Os10g0341401 [Oryza sativa Japonica Group]